MIELIHLKKLFNKTIAVDNLNMVIDSGKITAFLGPNGAGKTTTIKMMVGLLKPTEGIIKINGKNIEEDSMTYKKITSYIPDFPFPSAKNLITFITSFIYTKSLSCPPS